MGLLENKVSNIQQKFLAEVNALNTRNKSQAGVNTVNTQQKFQKKSASNYTKLLGAIYSATDPEESSRLRNALDYLSSDPSSEYYRPYSQPTNRARNYLEANGFNTSLLDNGWLNSQDANSYIGANLRYDGTGNTPKTPTRKSTADEYNAFWLYQYQLAEDDTNAAFDEIRASQNFINYWTSASDRNMSDDQIKQKYNEWYSKNCPTLQKMKNGIASRKLVELNKAVDFSDDTVDAMIWMARNPDYAGGIEEAIAMNYLGKGKQWHENPDVTKFTTTGDNPYYKPYAVGCTMDEERLRFNRDYFDQQWVDDNWNRIMSGNNEEDKKALRKVQGAITYYDGLKTAYKDMKDEIADMLTWTTDADYIINEIKGNSAYKDLFALDKTMNKTDEYGILKDLPDKFDYKFTEVEDYIRKSCTDKRNLTDALRLVSEGFNTAVTGIDVKGIKKATEEPVPTETPAPGPAPTTSGPVPTPTPKATPSPTETPAPTPTPSPADVIGQYGKGNIDLYNRPQVVNDDGSISTIRSMSFYDEDSGKEILVPTVVDGKVVSDEEARDHYYETGEYLGMFDTPEEATEYAINLHDQQAEHYGLKDETTEEPVTEETTKAPVISPKVFSDTDTAIEKQTNKDYNAVKPTFVRAGTPEEKSAVVTGNTSYFDKCVQALGEKVADFNAALKTNAVSKIQKEFGDQYIVTNNYEKTQQKVEELQAELDSFASEYYQLSWDNMQNESLAGLTSEQYENLVAYSSAPKGTYPELDSAKEAVQSDKDPFGEGWKKCYEMLTGQSVAFSDEDDETLKARVKLWLDYIDSGKAQEGTRMLSEEEVAKFADLKRKKDDIESQIRQANEYLDANEQAYNDANRASRFTTMLYNDACKRDSSLDPSLFLGVELVYQYAGNNTGYSYMPNYTYDVQAEEGTISAEDAANSAYADSVNYTAGYNSLLNTYNNLVKEGVQFTDQQKRNIKDTLDSIKDYGSYSAFASLDGEEDFQSVVDNVISNPSEYSNGTFIYDAIWQAYKYDAPVLTGGDDRYESIDVMNKKEMARYLYLKGTGQYKEADDYLKLLCDPDKGMLTVRKTAGTQEEGYNLATSLGGVGSFFAVPLDIFSSTVSWIAPLAYRAGQGITGQSVSPYNKAFRGQYLQKGLQSGYTSSVHNAYADVFGEGSFFQKAGDKMLQIGVGAGKMYAGSKVSGALFAGLGVDLGELASALETTSASVRIAKSAADVLIPSISSANDKYLEVLSQTHDEVKAGQMFNSTLVSGLITYSVVMNGLKDNSTISSGIKGMFSKILKTDASVGLSTYVSSAIDKIVDKNVMGDNSKWATYYNKFRNEDHYPDQVAKRMADEKTMMDINTEVWEAVKTSTYRTLIQSTIGYVATKADEINETIKREFSINDVSKEAPKYDNGVALWDAEGRILDENGKVMLDADGNPVYKDMLDVDAFAKHEPGYNTATGQIVDGNGNVIGKVPNGMIPNQLGGTVMKDRATGRTFESIGYIKDNASGNLYFVTSNGQFVPLANVISGNNPAIADMSQREFGLISEALDYYFYPGFGEQPTNYFIGDTSTPVDTQPVQQTETTTSRRVSGYLPNDTWGTPVTEEPVDTSKDLSIISSIYNANPTAASIGTTAILNLPDPNMSKAAGQTFVGEVANGDSTLVSTALLQMISKTQNPAETKTDLAMASLTNGAGKQALQGIISKLQSGEAITEEDVNALHNGVEADRSSSPVSFNEAVQQKVRDVRIGNETVRLTAGNPQIQSETEKVNSAKADLAEAEKDLDKAQSEYEVINQNAQDSLTTLGETGNKPDVGPVEQTLNQVEGADARVADAEDNVAEQRAKVEAVQKAADDVVSKILTENRVQAQQAVDTQIQSETEAQETLAEAEFEQNLATYTPTMPFKKPITIPLVNGDEVEMLGAHGVGKDRNGNYVTIWSTTNGYVMDSEIDWTKAQAKDDQGKPLYPTYAQSAIDKAINYFAENGNAIEPYKWFKHSLSAYNTDKNVDVDLIGLAGQNQDGDLVFMDKDGNYISDTTLAFNKDPFTGEDGYTAQFNMTADVDYDELPVITREDLYKAEREKAQRLAEEQGELTERSEVPGGLLMYPYGPVTVTDQVGNEHNVVGIDIDYENGEPLMYVLDDDTEIPANTVSEEPDEFTDWWMAEVGQEKEEPTGEYELIPVTFDAAQLKNDIGGTPVNSDELPGYMAPEGTTAFDEDGAELKVLGVYADEETVLYFIDGVGFVEESTMLPGKNSKWTFKALDALNEQIDKMFALEPEQSTPQPVIADITGNDVAFNYGDWDSPYGTKHDVIYPKDPENFYAIVSVGEGDEEHPVTIEGLYAGATGAIYLATDHGAIRPDEINPGHLSDMAVDFLKWAQKVAESELANPSQGKTASQDYIDNFVTSIDMILPAEATQQDVDHLFGNDQFQYQTKEIPSLQNKALISPVLGNADGKYIDGISIDGNGDLLYTLHGVENGYIDAHSADVNTTKFLEWAIEAAKHLKETGAIEDTEINDAVSWLNDQLSMADDDIELGNADFQPASTQNFTLTDELGFGNNGIAVPNVGDYKISYKPYNGDLGQQESYDIEGDLLGVVWTGDHVLIQAKGTYPNSNHQANGTLSPAEVDGLDKGTFDFIVQSAQYLKDHQSELDDSFPWYATVGDSVDSFIKEMNDKFPQYANPQAQPVQDTLYARDLGKTKDVKEWDGTEHTLELYDWQDPKFHGRIRPAVKKENPNTKDFREWQDLEGMEFLDKHGNPMSQEKGWKYFVNNGEVTKYFRGYGKFGHFLYGSLESKEQTDENGKPYYINFMHSKLSSASSYAGTTEISQMRYIDNWETAMDAMKDLGFHLIEAYDPSGSGKPGYQLMFTDNYTGELKPMEDVKDKSFFFENELSRFRKTYGGNPHHKGILAGFPTGKKILVIDGLHTGNYPVNYTDITADVTLPNGYHYAGTHKTRLWAQHIFSHSDVDTIIFDEIMDEANGGYGEHGVEICTRSPEQFKSIWNRGKYSKNSGEYLAMKTYPSNAKAIKAHYGDATHFSATGEPLSIGWQNLMYDLHNGKAMEDMTPEEKQDILLRYHETPESQIGQRRSLKEPTLPFDVTNAIRDFDGSEASIAALRKAKVPEKTIELLKNGASYNEAVLSTFTPEDVEEIYRLRDLMAIDRGSPVFGENGEVDSYTGPVRHDKEIHFIVGMPGVGKSTLADPLAAKIGARNPDPDTPKHEHKKNNGGKGGNDGPLHNETRLIAKLAQEIMMENGDNIVKPIVGHSYDSVRREIDAARKDEYKVYIHRVSSSWNESVARALNRYAKETRNLDFDYLVGEDGKTNISPAKIKDVFDKIVKEGLVDGYAEWDNNVPKGQPPIPTSYSEEDLVRISGGAFGGGQGHNTGVGGRGTDGISEQSSGIQALKTTKAPVTAKPKTATEKNAQKVKGKLKSPQEILNTLTNELGIGNYRGTNKFGSQASAKGYYDADGKLVAVKNKWLGDPGVGGHESGHAIFDMIDMTSTPEMVDNMIMDNPENIDFSQYKPNQLASEAEAEFVRRYLKSEAEARKFAGDDFYNEFEAKIAANPKLYKAVTKARDAMRQWYEASESERIGSVIKYDKYPEKKNLDQDIKNIIARVVDKSAPAEEVNNMIRRITGKGDIAFDQDTRANSLLGNHSQKRSLFILNNSMTNPDGEIIGDGFAQAVFVNSGLKYTKENLHELNKYMTAKHSVDREAQAKPVFTKEITQDDVNSYIHDIETTRPDVVAAAEAAWDWWRQFRQAWLTDRGGRLPQDVADMWDEMYPHYAPTLRVGGAIDSAYGLSRGGGKDIKFKSATGSTQDVFSPIHSMIGMVQQVVDTVLTDEAARAFDNAYQQNPGLGVLARFVPGTEKEEIVANEEELNRRQQELLYVLTEGGVDDDIIDQVLEITKSKPGISQATKDPGYLTVHRNDGTVVRYQFDNPYLYGLLAGVRSDANRHPVLDAFGSFTRLMSKLTTGSNPFFALRNATRDYQNSVNYGTWSKGGNYLMSAPTWFKAVVDIARGESETAKQYLALGGGGWTRGNINNQKGMKQLENEIFGVDTSTAKGKAEKVGEKLAGWLTLEWINGVIEQGSRYAEFAFGNHDLSTPEGRKKAFLASQDVTVDFSRKGIGPEAYWLSKTVPFFAASANGVYRTARQFAQAERGRTVYDEDTGKIDFGATAKNVKGSRATKRAVKTIMNMGITSALAIGSIIMFGDEETKEQYRMLSDEIKKNHIILPNPLRYVDKGQPTFIRIPIEQDPLAYLVNWGVTNALWRGEDDELAIGFGALASVIADNLNPVTGSILQPFVDASHHRTYYGSSTIRSTQKDWTDATIQYNEDTPELFRATSRFLQMLGADASPEDIEYIFQQYTGFIGQTVLPAISYDREGNLEGPKAALKTFTNQWTADATRSTKVINDFFAMKGSFDTIKKAANSDMPQNMFKRSLTQSEVDQAYLEAVSMLDKEGIIGSTYNEISQMYNDIDAIYANSTLTDSQKAQLVRERKMETMRLVEAANDKLLEYYDKYMKDDSILDWWSRQREGMKAHVPTDAEKMDDYFKNDTSEYMNRVMSVYEGSSGKDSNGNQLGGNAAASLPHPNRKLTINKKEYQIEDKDWDEYKVAYKNAYEAYVMNSDNGRKWDKLSDAEKYSVLKQAHAKGNDAMRKLYKKKHGIK